MSWEFLDFVDQRGVNQIKAWVEGLAPSVRSRVKAKFNERLRMLQVQPVLNDPKLTKMLDGECDGLMEVRFRSQRVQYRPLAWYGPSTREITLLIGAEERENRFVPSNACQVALQRRTLVLRDRRQVCPHDFS